MENKSQKRLLNSLLSAFLSLINPGLGQLRNGQLLKGIFFYLIWYGISFVLLWSGSYRSFQSLILIIILHLGLMIYFISDAFYIAYKTTTPIKKPYNRWFIYIGIIILNILVATQYKEYINTHWMTAHRVPTSSMEPTLYPGDYFIGDYNYYKNNVVQPGDVVILKYPKNPDIKYIERCIAMADDIVEIKDKKVYVNGKYFRSTAKIQFSDKRVYPAEYIDPEIYPSNAGNRDNYGPVIVPKSYCFVLGDNRDNSYDSRYWGFVPLTDILAKPLYVYWSGNRNRIGISIE